MKAPRQKPAKLSHSASAPYHQRDFAGTSLFCDGSYTPSSTDAPESCGWGFYVASASADLGSFCGPIPSGIQFDAPIFAGLTQSVDPSAPGRPQSDAPTVTCRTQLDATAASELDAPTVPCRTQLDAATAPCRTQLEATAASVLDEPIFLCRSQLDAATVPCRTQLDATPGSVLDEPTVPCRTQFDAATAPCRTQLDATTGSDIFCAFQPDGPPVFAVAHPIAPAASAGSQLVARTAADGALHADPAFFLLLSSTAHPSLPLLSFAHLPSRLAFSLRPVLTLFLLGLMLPPLLVPRPCPPRLAPLLLRCLPLLWTLACGVYPITLLRSTQWLWASPGSWPSLLASATVSATTPDTLHSVCVSSGELSPILGFSGSLLLYS